jgi:hypothetical protein
VEFKETCALGIAVEGAFVHGTPLLGRCSVVCHGSSPFKIFLRPVTK